MSGSFVDLSRTVPPDVRVSTCRAAFCDNVPLVQAESRDAGLPASSVRLARRDDRCQISSWAANLSSKP